MPQATRLGDMSTGHDLCPPKALSSASHNVNINGKPAGRKGDQYETHSCDTHSAHKDTISGGSGSVFINNLPAARVGDALDKGGSIASGSDNVFVGG